MTKEQREKINKWRFNRRIPRRQNRECLYPRATLNRLGQIEGWIGNLAEGQYHMVEFVKNAMNNLTVMLNKLGKKFKLEKEDASEIKK